MAKMSGVNVVEMVAVETDNLDTKCFRGSAPLAHLALISQADVFDQVTNPNGLQRDLSPKHASDAYEYVNQQPKRGQPRAFTEVVLNVRDKKCVEITPMEGIDGLPVYTLRFHLDRLKGKKVYVSRVDGNHRLEFAEGDDRQREPLLAKAPFQLHVGLTPEQERSIFVDINSNQKGMNTSHLAMMMSKLTPEEMEIRDHLDRWIAKKLSDDPNSPWHGLVHLGGSKEGSRTQGLTRPVNFVSVEAGIKKLLSKSQYIHDLTDPTAQYALVRNYWRAVKTVFAEEWGNPKEFLLLKNIGVMSLSTLGGTIIDRCIPQGRVTVGDMARYLKQSRATFNWSKEATGDRAVVGMSGNKAALIIASEMGKELSDDTDMATISDLQQQLLAQAT
ncbi:MAG: DGQHR domain-containing protein [Planctomycetes bacterium]|nr:DGQHR domain-containing protein [Planctomycetota bacterium]